MKVKQPSSETSMHRHPPSRSSLFHLTSALTFILGIAFSNVYFYMKPYYRSMIASSSSIASETMLSACDQTVQTALKTAAAKAVLQNNHDNEDSSSSIASSFPVIEYPPSVKHVVINIGSNLDPLMPDPKVLGPCARSIAVEPIVGCQIKSHRQLDVLHAAIGGGNAGNTGGVASMNVYNNNGVSSSLAKPAEDAFWNNQKHGKRRKNGRKRYDGSIKLVPLLTLESLLNSIPQHIQIVAMKTDMQGYDFVAIQGGGQTLLERVPHLMTEVWDDDVYSYNAKNDLCRDWLPYMTQLGYDLVKTRYETDPQKVIEYCKQRLIDFPTRPSVNESAGLHENDAYWIRRGSDDASNVTHVNLDITLPKYRPTFTSEDYESCGF